MAEKVKYLIKSGQKAVAVAGTAEKISASSLLAERLRITALAGNVGVVYVGDSGVDSTNGYELAAGDSLPLDQIFGKDVEGAVFDLTDIWVDAANNGDAVSYSYFPKA